MTRYATIAGVGSSLPPRLVPNSWFESFVETNDAWIRDRTGIEARHFADEGTNPPISRSRPPRRPWRPPASRPSSST